MLTGIRKTVLLGIAAGFLAIGYSGCASGIDEGQAIDRSLRDAVKGGVELNAEERELYLIVNRYRNEKGLHAIPLSPSLTRVAQLHVRDLENNPPKGKCNMHSWSENGPWSPCCYTDDHAAAQCVWDKPRELTSYKGNGYENSHGGTGGYRATARNALEGWKHSSGHNNTMLNRQIWKDTVWRAVGVGVYGGYAVLWFGEETDAPAK